MKALPPPGRCPSISSGSAVVRGSPQAQCCHECVGALSMATSIAPLAKRDKMSHYASRSGRAVKTQLRPAAATASVQSLEAGLRDACCASAQFRHPSPGEQFQTFLTTATMLEQFKRKCDHCKKRIRTGDGYLWAKVAVHTDVAGIPNVTADSTRIDDEKIVELHKQCASAYFQQPDSLPEVRALPPPRAAKVLRAKTT